MLSSINPKVPIILASGSESRRLMLEEAGIVFQVVTSDVDESILKEKIASLPFNEQVIELAKAKAVAVSSQYPEAFVIGGGEIYKRFLEKNLIQRMYVTHINESFNGDTYFPKIDFNKWNATKIMSHTKDQENPHDFKVMLYEKKD